MVKIMGNPKLGIVLNAVMAVVFIIAAVIIVLTVNYNMRQQALVEAQSKAGIILDRNLATHTYFTHVMKPRIFAWTKPFRSKEYFDPSWMSSTYAVREIGKYFASLNSMGYYFKDAAIDARSPENEAEGYERIFIEKLKAGRNPESESAVRNINGKLFLTILRKGEVMETSCLRCHSVPKNAPKGLIDNYGSERSFNRKANDVASAVSIRIPLSEAYMAANIFSWKLSIVLLVVLACLFFIQYFFYRRYLLKPLGIMQEKATLIAMHEEHLGEEIEQPYGMELNELTLSFNKMSKKLRHDMDNLEELVRKRTEALGESEEQYRSLFENMLDGFAYCRMIYDEKNNPVDFVYLVVNGAFEDLTGLKDVAGKKVSAVIPGIRDSNPELFDIYSRVAMTGNPESIEIQIKVLNLWLSIAVYSNRKEHFAAVFENITERKKMEEQLLAMSVVDELTGLYNRRGFFALAGQQMKIAERAGKKMMLFFADLDKMKEINDTLGHQEGDKALVEIAAVLKHTFRESDIMSRIGGDEFAVLAIDTNGRTGGMLIERLNSCLDEYNRIKDRNYLLSLSIGMAHYDPENPSTLDELMSRADTLMYQDKRSKQ